MPQSVYVDLADRAYNVIVGANLVSNNERLQTLCSHRQVAIVSNTTVAPLYGDSLKAAIGTHASQVITIELPDGESFKKWQTLQLIFDELLKARFDRKALIIALGGGVVGDMAGFAAATYQRGIDFVQIPTTLLSQVDSSVGGKTGINHPAGKNMIGAFYQPKLVLADVGTLKTLPQRELIAGLAEIIKHGAIADLNYLQRVIDVMPKLLACDESVLTEIVTRSVEIKTAVVIADEHEANLRATLNYGHTFGHAIEAGLGYGEWLHGEAVGCGMVMAADLSHRLGLLNTAEQTLLYEAIEQAGLPMRGPQWSADRYIELMSVDKKAQAGIPKFVLLQGLGKACVQKVDELAVRATLAACI